MSSQYLLVLVGVCYINSDTFPFITVSMLSKWRPQEDRVEMSRMCFVTSVVNVLHSDQTVDYLNIFLFIS
jgi:hypothetical protein